MSLDTVNNESLNVAVPLELQTVQAKPHEKARDISTEAVRTVFVQWFCTPKSSMENPSVRVSGHGRSMNRTFSWKIVLKDDFGQWDTDEVTREQGHIDDERQCFWTWDDTECAWQCRPLKGRQVKRSKGKRKGKRQRTIQKNRKSIVG